MQPPSPWAKASPGATPPDAPALKPRLTNGPESAPDRAAWPRAASPATTSLPDDVLTTDFVGRRAPLFWLALKTGVFTVLTLGLYRFWMKTRLRRWYWSAIRPGGLPLEYVGDPVEKLLGFLIAVVILAFYTGLVNLVLTFASFALFQGNVVAYALSFAGLVPLWFYAQYRARRYVLARTRWRGLRFGLAPGAWGYAGRALWHWALTILSLGLLWPRMTFWLEKYRTDRTSYGTAQMVQGGRWQMLYPATRPMFVAAALALASAVAGYALPQPGPAVGLGILAAMTAVYGVAHYRVRSLQLLTGAKRLGGVGLKLDASPFRILMIHVLGYLLAGFALALPLMALGAIAVALQLPHLLEDTGAPDLDSLRGLPRWGLIGLSVLLYFAVFLLWSAFTHCFVTLPALRHYARGLQITGADHLATIRQRDRDEVQQAEGFAEALDVGASI